IIPDAVKPARLISAVNPHSAHIGVSRVVGITHVVSRPTGGLMSGQAALINLAGFTASRMAVVPQRAAVIQLPGQGGGFRGFGGGGGQGGNAQAARTAAIDSLKQMLDDAEAYGKAIDAWKGNSALPRPRADVVLESLVPVVRGDMPVIFPAESQADIRAAVEFARERKLKPIILGGRDSWRMTDFLKQNDVAVIFTHTMSIPQRDDDPYDANYSAAAKLAA